MVDDIEYGHRVYSLVADFLDGLIISIEDKVKELNDEHILAAEDSPLENPWMAYCYYCQYGPKFYVDMYQDLIEGLSKRTLENLSDLEISLLYLHLIDEVEESIEDLSKPNRKHMTNSLIEPIYGKVYQSACGEDLPESVL